MNVGQTVRDLREAKNLSQGDMEERTGLVRCYLSRIENGHSVPVIGTLEKIAKALEVPLYVLLYDGEQPPKEVKPPRANANGQRTKDDRYFEKLARRLAKTTPERRKLIMVVAQKMKRS